MIIGIKDFIAHILQCKVTKKGQPKEKSLKMITVGSGVDCDICFGHKYQNIDSIHAVFTFEKGSLSNIWKIWNTSYEQETYLNSCKLEGDVPSRIYSGDWIDFAHSVKGRFFYYTICLKIWRWIIVADIAEFFGDDSENLDFWNGRPAVTLAYHEKMLISIGVEYNKRIKRYSQRNRHSEYKIRSQKNIYLAAVLALLLGYSGAHNWYLGYYRRAMISGIITMMNVAASFMMESKNIEAWMCNYTVVCKVLFVGNMMGGIVDAIRIVMGHVKDTEGKFLMTRQQYYRQIK